MCLWANEIHGDGKDHRGVFDGALLGGAVAHIECKVILGYENVAANLTPALRQVFQLV